MICHSGGCPGSDMFWEAVCKEVNIKTISYSFPGHTQYGEHPRILTPAELNEGWQHILKASKSIKRNADNMKSTYVRCLLCRNWFQVKNSDAIFAIGKINNNMVDGGTGWAVQMAIDENKPVFVFEQNKNIWYSWNYNTNLFEICDVPTLTENFAGIGTRELNKNGEDAIKNIIIKHFENESKNI